MNIVNPNNTSHDIKIIPRFGTPFEVVFELYNEQTQLTETIVNTFTFSDGYLTILFNYDFIDGQKFQIKLIDDITVIYRGKLMATTQTPQTFKASKDLYYYE